MPTIDRKYALVLLVKEIMSQIDEVASLRSQGHPANLSSLLLREMCSVLKELGPELEEVYFEILVKLVADSKPPVRVSYSQEYVEVSVDAKRKLVEKVKAALNA